MGCLWVPGALQTLRIEDFKAPGGGFRCPRAGALHTFKNRDFIAPGAPETTHSKFDKNLIKI